MTDRVVSLTVILKQETRTDDASEVANLISLLEPVAHVDLGPVQDVSASFERARIRRELVGKLDAILKGE